MPVFSMTPVDCDAFSTIASREVGLRRAPLPKMADAPRQCSGYILFVSQICRISA
jgi:hypothetical protein